MYMYNPLRSHATPNKELAALRECLSHLIIIFTNPIFIFIINTRPCRKTIHVHTYMCIHI